MSLTEWFLQVEDWELIMLFEHPLDESEYSFVSKQSSIVYQQYEKLSID